MILIDFVFRVSRLDKVIRLPPFLEYNSDFTIHMKMICVVHFA